MSDWSLMQWTDQLKSTDEAARHEAAAMLGEQGNAASVDPLLKVAGREAGFWHATDGGEPQEPEFTPLCKTATEALRALAPADLLQASADLKAWQAWRSASILDRGDKPERRGTPLGNLAANLANTSHGEFDPDISARAAWVIGEVGWALRKWDHFLGLDIDWPWFVTLPASKHGPTPKTLIRFMAETNLPAADALRFVSELRGLLADELAHMLGGIRDRRERGEPSDLVTPMRELIASLGRLGEDGHEAVILSVLRAEWPELHTVTTITAGQLQLEGAVAPLLKLLPRSEGVQRARIATALGRIGDRTAAKTLLKLLNDDDPAMRTEAARALGRLGISQTRDRLFQSLLDPDETVRFAVGTALGQLGDARTVPFLLRAIEDGDAVVQQEAEDAMASLGKNALSALVQLLRSGKPPYRAIAAQRLGDLADPRSIKYLIPSLLSEDCQREVSEALHKIGTPAVAPLVEYLKAEDPNLADVSSALQEQVARVLGKLGDTRAVEPLIRIAGDQERDPRLREEAVRVLGKLGDDTAEKTLIDALKDRKGNTPGIRAEAARSLGMLRSRAALTFLVDAMREPDDALRNYAIDALGEVGDPRAVEPLIDELNGFRRGGRAGVIQALGKLQGGEAIPHLLEVADEQPRTYLNSFAIRALSQLGEPSVVPMVLQERAFHQELPQVIRYLGSRALSPLVDQLRTGAREDVRALAAMALGELGEPRTMGSLIQALQDPSEAVQKAAARSLARLHASK